MCKTGKDDKLKELLDRKPKKKKKKGKEWNGVYRQRDRRQEAEAHRRQRWQGQAPPVEICSEKDVVCRIWLSSSSEQRGMNQHVHNSYSNSMLLDRILDEDYDDARGNNPWPEPESVTNRTRRKTSSLSAKLPEGWDSASLCISRHHRPPSLFRNWVAQVGRRPL